MSDRSFYWERYADDGRWRGSARPPGASLAALRQGVGRAAGSVPSLWPFYTTLNPEGALTRVLRAEHAALVLYGVHQQGESHPVHAEGVSVGRAMAVLRDSGRHSADAVERRFVAAATADSLDEVATHLRSLVQLLKTLPNTPALDYTRLFKNLVAWQDATGAERVRRQWGSAFYWQNSSKQSSTSKEQS